MEDLFKDVDLRPLLQNDTILTMNDYDIEEGDGFNPELVINNVRKQAQEKCAFKTNDTVLTTNMFYFDMISFDLLFSDKTVVWMAAEHPVAMLLEYYKVKTVYQVGKNWRYGDVVIYYEESVDWCIDKIINKTTNE